MNPIKDFVEIVQEEIIIPVKEEIVEPVIEEVKDLWDGLTGDWW